MARTMITVVTSLLAAVACHGGVVFHMETRDLEASNPQAREATISVEGGRLMMQWDARSRVVYDSVQDKMTVINDGEKSYLEIDQQTIEQLAERINPALEQMRQHMANLPPAQRAMMEKMMGRNSAAMGAAPKELQVRATAERQTILQYPCVRYDILEGDEKVQEMWITEWDQIEGADQAKDVFEAMAEFFQRSFQSFSFPGSTLPQNPFTRMQELDGFPIRGTEFAGGKPRTETTFRSVEQKTLGEAFFSPPAGYQKRDMAMR